MRWFVEVSRVGENSSDEKYCVEAKQWQAALQEARKLRGDSGPLSKFSIELLDDGYRAVDPKQKLRFVVAKAPQDAELSTESAVRSHVSNLNGQSASAGSLAPASPSLAPASPSLAPASPSFAPAPVVAAPAPLAAGSASVVPPVVAVAAAPSLAVVEPPAATPPVVVAPPAVATPVVVEPPPLFVPVHAEPYAGVPSSALSPNAPASATQPSSGVTVSPSVSVGASTVKSPSAFPPRPVTAFGGSARPAASAKPPGGITVPADVIPAAPAVPQGLGPPVASPQNFTQPSAAIDMPPPASVLRKRQEEPSPESPITYREVAYVVDPSVTRGSVEALLWASFRDLSRELADRTGQKFVQLAVFDHHFDKRPERAPLGTLAWKDWRGNPVITFPLFDGTAVARASMPAPSIKPVPVVQISSSAPPAPLAAPAPAEPLAAPAPAVVAVAPEAPAPAAPVAPSPSAAPLAPVAALPVATTPVLLTAPPASLADPSAAPPTPPASLADPSSAPPASLTAPPASLTAPPASLTAPVEAKSEPQAAIPLTRSKQPSNPSGGRASRPGLAAVRRRAGEDLIGELFETMHDLHFMHGVVDGAEFMLAAVESIVPCEGVLIHVFDINTRQFVIVRARGAGALAALSHRTPDSETFFNAVMRRPGSVAIHDVDKDPRVLGPRWETLGVKPQRVLAGPVRQGGRYLGLLELANPLGDAPFHQTEQNAIDYICEQFAQFLANRPIVLDSDVILRR